MESVAINVTTAVSEIFNNSLNNSSYLDDILKINATQKSLTGNISSSTKAGFQIAQKAIFVGILPILVTVGIIGNILTILILCRNKDKTSTTVLLFCLAIADLSYLICISITTYNRIANIFYPEYGKQLLLKLITPFNPYILPLPARIGNWITAVIAMERVLAVTSPITVKRISTKRTMIITNITLTLTIAIFTIPNIFLYELETIQLPDGNTTTIVVFGIFGKQTRAFEIYTIASEVILRFIPIGIVITCNCVIIITLFSNARWRTLNTDSASKTGEYQITKMLLTVTVVFIICLMPITISRLMSLLDGVFTFYEQSSRFHQILLLPGFVTETFNSAINFFIYTTISTKYRTEFRNLCCRKNPNITTVANTNKNKIYRISETPETSSDTNQASDSAK